MKALIQKIKRLLRDGSAGSAAASAAEALPEKAKVTVRVEADEEYKEPIVFFETDSFSVYAIVYTVDFHWEIDGKEYKFCITGGTGVSLKEVLSQIHVVKGDDDTGETATDLSADAFINKVTEVTFSDPDLLYVYKVEQEITTLGIKQEAELNPEYSALMTRQEIDEADEKVYTAPDWALLTLKPFFTEESLRIAMADGVISRIIVTENDPETTDIDESLVKNWTVVGDNDDGNLRFHAARAAAVDDPVTTEVNEAAPAANATFTLGNIPGAALPNSGGPGTRLYLLLGGTLIAGVLLARRRKIS